MGFNDFLDALGAGLDFIARAVLATLVQVVAFLGYIAQLTLNLLFALARWALEAVRKIAAFFRHFHLSLLKDFLSKLWEDYKRLRDLIRRHLDPWIKMIAHYRRLLDQFFNTYLRPILNVIRAVRQGLLILRLLHVKFAARLDARLARLEGKITEIFLDLYRQVNRLGNIVNLLVDPLGLIPSPQLLGALARAVEGLFHQLRKIRERPLGAAELESEKREREFGAPAATRDFALARLSGAPDPWVADLKAAIDAEFKILSEDKA